MCDLKILYNIRPNQKIIVVLFYQLNNYKIFTQPYKVLPKIYYCPISFSLSLHGKKGREGKMERCIKGDTL